jgi:chemotaxis protein MotB
VGAIRKAAAPEGAPEWALTYGDIMSLLLCLFVALVSMSEVRHDRFQQAATSLQRAFGGHEGDVGDLPAEAESLNTLIAKLSELEVPKFTDKKGDSPDEGIRGRNFRVTNVREGLQIVVGGKISFDRFSANLKPEARELVAQTAERIRGYNTRIVVRGHATREPLPDGAPFKDARDLSYARAKAVARELEEAGVRRVRILVVAAGDGEPLTRQAYTEERRALNRRVEILVTEDLVDDYAGSGLADELKESGSGG